MSETCNLSDEAFEARRRLLREQWVPHIRSREALSDGVAFTFEATRERRRALDDFVAFERGCCPSLRFTRHEAAGTLRLEIHGLDPEVNLFSEAGRGEEHAPAGSSVAARVVRAGGLGAVGAFGLLCGVPLAVAAVAGARFAAPLGVLDHPFALGLGTLLLSAGIWVWERRAARKRPGAGRAGAC
jgi:hypothetical protein